MLQKRYDRLVEKSLTAVEKAETLIDHLEGPTWDFFFKNFLKSYSNTRDNLTRK